MFKRCYDKSSSTYEYYKDVFVCDEWQDFNNFISDMGGRPSGYTLDRIDNSCGYNKHNCRWVTIEEQRVNRGRFKNSLTKYKGVSKNGKKFVSSIRHKCVSYYLGTFDSEVDAAIAYNEKLKEFYPQTFKQYINKV